MEKAELMMRKSEHGKCQIVTKFRRSKCSLLYIQILRILSFAQDCGTTQSQMRRNNEKLPILTLELFTLDSDMRVVYRKTSSFGN